MYGLTLLLFALIAGKIIFDYIENYFNDENNEER